MFNRREVIVTGLSVGASVAIPTASCGAGASRAEIRRDSFGVPHIIGKTDADCIFALAYAQAEDGLDYIADCYFRAIGRGAEVHGEDALQSDLKSRALEIARHSRAEYDASSPVMRRIYDAYHKGLEQYVSDNKRSLGPLGRFEPWHCLALLRFKYYVDEFLGYAGLTNEDWKALADRPMGSNAWAVAPSKSASGKAMLLINPHVGFFGIARYYECTIMSDEGLRFQGITRYGFPVPYMGHNDRLGWAHTDNYPDNGDLYAETIVEDGGRSFYRFGSELRPLRQWSERIPVKSGDQITEQTHEFQATHHGPLMGARDGKPLAVRLARFVEGGWFDQWYDMCRATNLAEFRAAVSRCAVAYMNIVYADAAGNIAHIYGGAVPKRSTAFDWRKPVDGSNPQTEWQGMHSLEELPQTLNPPSGYVQSCNSTPFTVAGDAPERRDAYPAYMIGPETDNPRAQRSRAILGRNKKFTFADWQRAATDTTMHMASGGVSELAAAWDKMASGERKDRLAPLVTALRSWDGVARVESVPTTIFVGWMSRRKTVDQASPEQLIEWLSETRDELIGLRGTWQVPWGQFNRLQHIPWSQPVKFSDARPSLPIPGTPGWTGIVFNFYTDPPKGTTARYGMMGNSYVATVEFGAKPQSRSVLVFGQGMEPGSIHYEDQSALYAQGKFKDNHWSAADIATMTKVKKRP